MPTRAIKAIFYTRFHHEKGSRVLHQVPEGSITPSTSPSALPTPLIPFETLTSYLIPNQQFRDRLITFCSNHYRIIGYPVCIRDLEGKIKYERNEFIFNLALVVEEGLADWVAYGEVIRKLGRLLRGLEEQGGFLSGEESSRVWEEDFFGGGGVGGGYFGWGEFGEMGAILGGGSKVHALCENVLEDLNNFAECMIPIDDSNTINLKLFPTRPPPPPVHAHTVPLLTISLSSLSRPLSSDLTLARILPHINGINSVSLISQLADTDLSLTRKAIQHLVYYGCLVLLDVFSFSAIYAPTAEIGGFVTDETVGEECARYVQIPRQKFGSASTLLHDSSTSNNHKDQRPSISSTASSSSTTSSLIQYSPLDPASSPTSPSTATTHDSNPTIPHSTLITLYTSLRQGLPLRSWALENIHLLSNIDVRRLITFGIIKGFLYRVHKYAIATSISIPPPPPAPPASLVSPSLPDDTMENKPRDKEKDRNTIRQNTLANLLLSHTIHTTTPPQQTIPQNTAAAATTPPFPSISTQPSTQQPLFPATLEETTTPTPAPTTAYAAGTATEQNSSLPLIRFLDGMHCFDEICTELGMGERGVEAKIRGLGDVGIFCK